MMNELNEQTARQMIMQRAMDMRDDGDKMEIDFINLNEQFLRDVRNAAKHKGHDAKSLAGLLHEDMGVTEATARYKITQTLYHSATGVFFLPSNLNSRYHTGGREPRDNPRKLRQTSALLDALGFNPEDQLIKYIKQLYPSFVYPPAKRTARVNPWLFKPVSNLELSVRARKGVQRLLGSPYIGQLVQKTEEDLLLIWNLGRTSLHEIKQRLAEMGLSLGMKFDLSSPLRNPHIYETVSDLELSVRTRNCLRQIGIDNVAQLVQKTPSELLAYKNLGHTSLEEVEQQLEKFGLSLDMKLQDSAYRAAASKLEGAVSADPIKFFQHLDDLGVGFTFHHENHAVEQGDPWFISASSKRSEENMDNEFFVGIEYDDWRNVGESAVQQYYPKGLEDFIQGKTEINGMKISDVRLGKTSVSDFGRYSGRIKLNIQLARYSYHGERRMGKDLYVTPISDLNLSVRASNCLESARVTTIGELCEKTEAELLHIRSFGEISLSEVRKKLAEFGLNLDHRYWDGTQESLVSFSIVQPQKGMFFVADFNVSELPNQEFEPSLKSDFADVESAAGGDFRPYLHRAIEVYCGVPREQWHNPRIYTGDAIKMEEIVDTTLETLFTGQERQALQRQIENARLKMREGWMSVPRLNLGMIKLPNPGQRDITTDAFVTEAVPYLVEYLATLGVMSSEEAERVMAQKLTNYFIHQSGFQLSREKAEEVVAQLKQTYATKEKKEIA